MKIKAGRYYKNRQGWPVYILKTNGYNETYPVVGIVCTPRPHKREAYRMDGRMLKGRPSSGDLVELWGDSPRVTLSRKLISSLKRTTHWVW